jgi:hypothetical protein
MQNTMTGKKVSHNLNVSVIKALPRLHIWILT